jgi:hypothetical protein
MTAPFIVLSLDGKPILLLCQVDDFAMACPSEEVAQSIYGQIGITTMAEGFTISQLREAIKEC